MASARGESNGACHVLVVDDDVSLCEQWELECQCWRQPVRVSIARDGYQAVVLMAEDPPDLIITDLQMPYMDGLQLIEVMRRVPEYAAIPVIMVSGGNMPNQWEAPVIACYPKTVTLFSKVRRLVQEVLQADQGLRTRTS